LWIIKNPFVEQHLLSGKGIKIKVYTKILFALFITGMSFSVFAQECKKFVPNAKVEIQEFESINSKSYKGWKKIDIPNKISFYAPADFERVESNSKAGGHPSSAFWYQLSGNQLQNGFWEGKEVFQTKGFLENEFAKHNMKIEGNLPDDNIQSPSFLVRKN
jgi:hypothetical protein